VGSTARWLHDPTRAPRPRDLDVLLEATEVAIASLWAAMSAVGGWTLSRVPQTGRDLRAREPWQLMTRHGPLDVFADRDHPEDRRRTIRVPDLALSVSEFEITCALGYDALPR
jgi:hypothetical protein